MKRIVWTKPAVQDLASIVEYVARDSASYAEAVAEQIVLAAEPLARFAAMGTIVMEAPGRSIRQLLVQSYRILYRTRRTEVQILAVVHGARDLRSMKPRPWRRP